MREEWLYGCKVFLPANSDVTIKRLCEEEDLISGLRHHTDSDLTYQSISMFIDHVGAWHELELPEECKSKFSKFIESGDLEDVVDVCRVEYIRNDQFYVAFLMDLRHNYSSTYTVHWFVVNQSKTAKVVKSCQTSHSE